VSLPPHKKQTQKIVRQTRGRERNCWREPPTWVCTHHTRLSRPERTPYRSFGLLWPDTSMATQFHARPISARDPAGMRTCWGDPRNCFAPTTPGCFVVDARRTGRLDFYGQILLWPPNSAHGPPVHATRQIYGLVGGSPEIRLHPPHPTVASWTHAVPVVWTSMARYFYGHPIPPMAHQCTRRGRGAELLGGPRTLVCIHHTRLSRRGRTPYRSFGLQWPDTSKATQFRAPPASARDPADMRTCWGIPRFVGTHLTPLSRRGRTPYRSFGLLWPDTSMATQFRPWPTSARDAAGMRNCWADPGHWFAPTTPGCRVVDARRTGRLDFSGQILLMPPNSAHRPPVHATRQE